jgi:cytochrome d ubiquinol oxidase subunit I
MVLLEAAQGGAQVIPARAQMAATLGFHIILACFGIALPSIVLLAEFIGLRRGNETACGALPHVTIAHLHPLLVG